MFGITFLGFWYNIYSGGDCSKPIRVEEKWISKEGGGGDDRNAQYIYLHYRFLIFPFNLILTFFP